MAPDEKTDIEQTELTETSDGDTTAEVEVTDNTDWDETTSSEVEDQVLAETADNAVETATDETAAEPVTDTQKDIEDGEDLAEEQEPDHPRMRRVRRAGKLPQDDRDGVEVQHPDDHESRGQHQPTALVERMIR